MTTTSFSHYLTFKGGPYGSPLITDSSLGFWYVQEQEAVRTVVDDDNPPGIDADDYMNTSAFPYAGYTWTNPATSASYALFKKGVNIFIPHDGELNGVFPNTVNYSTTYAPLNEVAVATDIANCFLPGTLISTPSGERRVETLTIGDLVQSAEGRALAVKWIGRQTIMPVFGLPARNEVVEIARGALGAGLPHSDLRVTADHALLLNGILVHAGALVNGYGIRFVPRSDLGDRFTVFHIETEAHEIILANGAAAETFIDNVSRRTFDNYDEFADLYCDVVEMNELPYPRAMSARQVPVAVKALLQQEQRRAS